VDSSEFSKNEALVAREEGGGEGVIGVPGVKRPGESRSLRAVIARPESEGMMMGVGLGCAVC
jgi:hypothetical protein